MSATGGVYESAPGIWRGQVTLSWPRPANSDGSPITDGSHYEIGWRPVGLGWSTVTVGFDQTETTIADLDPGGTYEFRIRAVDAASPPHFGGWSPTIAETLPDAPVPAAAITLVGKHSDLAVTASTALVADPELVLPAAADTLYAVEAFLRFTADPAGNVQTEITAPPGTVVDILDQATTTARRLTGVVLVGATSGQVQVRFAQQTTSPTNSVLSTGSWLRLTKI